jgi:hypothetical protein
MRRFDADPRRLQPLEQRGQPLVIRAADTHEGSTRPASVPFEHVAHDGVVPKVGQEWRGRRRHHENRRAAGEARQKEHVGQVGDDKRVQAGGPERRTNRVVACGERLPH